MSEEIRITVLVENSVHRRGLVAEHGVAFHIQAGPRSLLFDTGQTNLVLLNAETLRIPLNRLEAVALSHGHYDHTGGLPAVLGAASSAQIYAHPAAFDEKYNKGPEGEPRFIGMSRTTAQAIRQRRDGLIETTGCTQILEGIFATGEIPRTTAYEDVGDPFFLDAECLRPDPLKDDQALFLECRDGIVVLLGCAHAGVVNTLEYIQHITNGRPIHTVLGGMHLLTASPERMAKTIETFQRLKIQRIAAAHCTGISAVAQLWAAFPGRCSTCAVGASMTFQNQCSRKAGHHFSVSKSEFSRSKG